MVLFVVSVAMLAVPIYDEYTLETWCVCVCKIERTKVEYLLKVPQHSKDVRLLFAARWEQFTVHFEEIVQQQEELHLAAAPFAGQKTSKDDETKDFALACIPQLRKTDRRVAVAARVEPRHAQGRRRSTPGTRIRAAIQRIPQQ